MAGHSDRPLPEHPRPSPQYTRRDGTLLELAGGRGTGGCRSAFPSFWVVSTQRQRRKLLVLRCSRWLCWWKRLCCGCTPDRRYQMHELTRQYAAEQLTAQPRLRSARRPCHLLCRPGAQQGHTVYTATTSRHRAPLRLNLTISSTPGSGSIDAISLGREGPARLRRCCSKWPRCWQSIIFSTSLWLAGQALFSHAAQVMEAPGGAARLAPVPLSQIDGRRGCKFASISGSSIMKWVISAESRHG